jgi:hypothetical protein
MVFMSSKLLLLSLGSWGALVNADSHNVTIDDSSELIQYDPPDGWPKGPCLPGCTIRPDASQFHDQSWRDNGVGSAVINSRVVFVEF